jgi:hypothetical protein
MQCLKERTIRNHQSLCRSLPNISAQLHFHKSFDMRYNAKGQNYKAIPTKNGGPNKSFVYPWRYRLTWQKGGISFLFTLREKFQRLYKFKF